jgi:DNA-binding MarR family transcriptional regulator
MPASLGEVLDFMRILWALDHGLQLTSKRMVATCGLTGPQRMVIRLVGRFPNISAGHLAQALHLHPSTLTGVLKRLESREILWRKPDPKDGRRALFGLTQKGRELDVPMNGSVESAIEVALAKLPRETVKATTDALAEIARQLTDSLHAPRGKTSTG